MARAIFYIGVCVFLCTLWMQRSMCANFVTVTARYSHDEIEKYWTEERMASAIFTVPPNYTAIDSSEWKVDLNASIEVKVEGVNQKSIVDTVGRLFYSVGDIKKLCSANVITSNNRDVIVTAKHCGLDAGGENYRFAPGYSFGNAPHGWWTGRKKAYVNEQGIPGDTGFLILNTQDGRHVLDAVGGTGYSFNRNPALLGNIHVWGIPGSTNYAVHYEGQAASLYQGTVVKIPTAVNLGGGASGGAFGILENDCFYQIASYFGSCGNKPCGPMLGSAALEAFFWAQGQ